MVAVQRLIARLQDTETHMFKRPIATSSNPDELLLAARSLLATLSSKLDIS